MARQGFLVLVIWVEGPAVHSAQGNALADGDDLARGSAQRANRSPRDLARWADNCGSRGQLPQGVALGWVNRAPSGQSKCRQEKSVHPPFYDFSLWSRVCVATSRMNTAPFPAV